MTDRELLESDFTTTCYSCDHPAPQAEDGGDALSDFKDGQWWMQELDQAVANGTPDQKRAVAVVRNLLGTIAAPQAEKHGGVGGCAMCGAAYEDQVIKADRAPQQAQGEWVGDKEFWEAPQQAQERKPKEACPTCVHLNAPVGSNRCYLCRERYGSFYERGVSK
jgi:hypothetical protein